MDIPGSLHLKKLIRLLALVTFSLLPALPVFAAGTYDGTVYIDYNGDGTMDTVATAAGVALGGGTFYNAVDVGVSGVTVTLTDSAGASVIGATDANGDYSLDSTPLAAGPYRLEFTAPTGYFAANASTPLVRFVANGGSTNDQPLINGDSYCQDNPLLVTPCYQGGDQSTNNDPVVVSFPYNSGRTATHGTSEAITTGYRTGTHDIMIDADEVGTTFGLAWDRVAEQLYVSAYMKRHAGYGPDGHDAIYQIDTSSFPVTTATTFFEMNTLSGSPAGSDFRLDPNWTGNTVVPAYLRDTDITDDSVGWDAVGKVSLGDAELSVDGDYMYVVALGNRSLYRLPMSGAINDGTVDVIDVPGTLTASACPSNDAGDIRPFGLGYKVWQGTAHLYLGVICSAESDQSLANLEAVVYEVSNLGTFTGLTERVRIELGYPRGYADGGKTADWHPWSPTYAEVTTSSFPVYAQPMLTQIAIDDDGSLILALRDRFGDQVGRASQSDISDVELENGITAGDTLRVCEGTPATPGSWVSENAGTCPVSGGGVGVTTVPASGREQGPGNGEFYGADEYEPYWAANPDYTPGVSGQGATARHDELSLGGVHQIPGYPQVAVTMFDSAYTNIGATGFNTAGVRWLNNQSLGAGAELLSGQVNRSYELFTGSTPGIFGKANGLGDIMALCEAAPLSIGDRIWIDTDADGIQDAGEIGLASVTVTLWDVSGSPTQVGSTTTDANGDYYFGGPTDNGMTGGNTLLVNTDYQIRISTTQGAMSGYSASPNDQGANDGIDSDGQTGVVTDNIVIAVTTGDPGENDFSLDQGVIVGYMIGDFVWEDTNGNGIQDNGEPPIQGVTVNLYDNNTCAGTPLLTDVTDVNGIYGFPVLPGTYYVEFVNPDGSMYTPSPADQGVDDAIDSDGECTGAIVIVDTDDLTIDQGYIPLVSIGDFVWADLNGNGIQDFNEPGISGATVNLHQGADCTGQAFDSMNTSSSGIYGFDVVPGSWSVSFPLPTGYTQRSPSNQGGDDTIDSDPDGTGCVNVTVLAGQDDLTIDAGFLGQMIGDFVWDDINADGIQDVGELGIPNVTVNLLDSVGNLLSSTTTDANGLYYFWPPPGDYIVEFVPPAGYVVSPQNAGANDAVDSDISTTTAQTAIFTVLPGVDDLTIDAGLYIPTADMTCTPNPLVFGDVQVDESETGEFTITNHGTGPATLSALNLTTGNPFTVVGGTCAPLLTLNPGESCTVEVKFKPSAVQSYQDTLIVDSDAPDTPETCYMTGRGFEKRIEDEPGVFVIDPAFTKNGAPENAVFGEEVTYTINITNTTNVAVAPVFVNDPVPDILDIVDVTTTQGTVSVNGQVVTADVGEMAPGQTVIVTIRAIANENAPIGEVCNVATATGFPNTMSAEGCITLGPGALPSTGGSPLAASVNWLLAGLAVVGGLLAWRLARHRRQLI